jgi:DNA polymerase-1
MSIKKDQNKKRLVVLDAHAIIHRAYHALPDFTSATGEPTGALYGLSAMLLKFINDLKPDYLVAAYDLPKPTYRHDAYKEYKAGRVKTEDDLIAQIERSRDVLAAFAVPIYQLEGFEADDVIGTIVEKLKRKKDIEVVIASGDTDTLQLVKDGHAKVFTLRKGIQDTVLYDEADVKNRYGFGPELLADYKGLRGDPSDNIPGIRGIGEKTATTLITTFGSIEEMYKKLAKDENAFEKAGITKRIIGLLKEGKEDAEFSKMLGTIRRDAPIEFSIPAAEWKEAFAPQKVLTLFNELGFRSLSVRVKEQFKSSDKLFADTPEPDAGPELSQEEREETKIAVWLLNSDLTMPTEEDILSFTKTLSLSSAREKALAQIKEEKLWDVFENIEKPLIPICAHMKETGVALDTGFLKELSRDYHKELSALEKKIWQRAGGEFNINSPKQLGDVLFEKLGLKNSKKTSTGQRSTRESELAKLADAHPIIPEIMQYRELQKLLSTYIDALPKQVGVDGRLHTTFVQTGAATGRMSSQNPNLQNIPIKTELGRAVRGAFVAQKGFTLAAFDYSQIELRLAAIVSRDEHLVQTFREGGDIHTAVASEIFDVKPDEVTATMRRTAKVINFGIIYGMGANALASTAEMPRADAQKYLAEYEATYTGVSEYIARAKAKARKKGYVETLFGRRRTLPGIRSPLPYIAAEAERQAINAPLQGTAADVIKIAMIDGEKYILEKGLSERVRLVLQIHDELIYEIADDAVEDVVPQIKKIMEKALPDEMRDGVPIVVEAEVGKRWSEMKKFES